FEDILHRADQLSSAVLSSERSGDHSFSGAEVNAQACIDEIFRRSETLWKMKQPMDEGGAALQADLLLGQRSFLLDPGPSSSFGTKIAGEEIFEKGVEVAELPSLEEMLPDMIQETAELVKQDAETAFLNRCEIESALLNDKESIQVDSSSRAPPVKKGSGVARLPLTSATNVELAFAKTLSQYVTDKNSDGLAKGFKAAADRSRDEMISSIWQQAVALLTLSVSGIGDGSPSAIRSSVEWTNSLVEGSLDYLQKHFMAHMRELVNRNLVIARVGGVPGTLTLVDGYLNVKHSQSDRLPCQDSVYGTNGHAIWEVVYHCFRSGDYESVAEIARSRLQNLPSCAALAVALCAIAKTRKLPAEDLDKVKAEWRAESGNTFDVYKKAVYCALLGGDVPEVCDNLENWLWLKFAPYALSVTLSPRMFAALQRAISIEYGEEYFTSNGGSATIFFQALWLTGQFERAIHLLYRSNMLVHAVHLAIMAYANGLLMTSLGTADPILEVNEKDSLQCSLNFSRLILIYVKPFECVDIRRAMDYYFCLHKFESPTGGSLFYACVSRAVHLSGDTEQVIGRVDEYGIRHEGLIDKYANEINVADAIAKVAASIELSAEPVKAVRLYHAAERHNDALRVMCDCMANAIKGYRDVEDPRRVAIWLASIYKRFAAEGCSLQLLTTLYLLIDLSTFFISFHQRNYPACLDIISKLKYIPMDMSEVSAFVSMFYTLSDEVRSLLPDVCLAMMRILDELSSHSNLPDDLSAKADAIVAFAA
uniref:Nuclear pore protein n=1 Tax=Parascaris univalens TaxID=6257 RepID=A0A915AW89_PARUN